MYMASTKALVSTLRDVEAPLAFVRRVSKRSDEDQFLQWLEWRRPYGGEEAAKGGAEV